MCLCASSVRREVQTIRPGLRGTIDKKESFCIYASVAFYGELIRKGPNKDKMTYGVLVYFSRKGGVSSAVFQSYFESHRIPVLKRTAGDTFPVSHTRMHLKRSEDGNCDTDMLRGMQDNFKFDGVVLMQFEDEAHFRRFIDTTNAEEQLDRFMEEPTLPD